jgi:hypothetical protein
MSKASVDQLNSLHQLVANQLAAGLDDPKTLSMAIKFLKDNDITADILESESMMSLTESIKKIAAEAETTKGFSVEDMLSQTH